MWKTRRDFEAELIARAWEDESFKTRLMNDPKSVVEELSGETLPKEMKVTIFQETTTSVCLVLPKNPDEELTEEDLSRVVGGVKLSPEEQARYQNNIFTRL